MCYTSFVSECQLVVINGFVIIISTTIGTMLLFTNILLPKILFINMLLPKMLFKSVLFKNLLSLLKIKFLYARDECEHKNKTAIMNLIAVFFISILP